MTMRGMLLAVTTIALLIVPAAAGPGTVAFPEKYRAQTPYWSVDRAVNDTVRLFYVAPESARKLKPTQPLPHGTVIVMEVYRAQLDGDGKPRKDTSGRFVRGELVSIQVMEKRAGWGRDYPDDLRNAEWDYAEFGPDGVRRQPSDTTRCLSCHRRRSGQDFVHTRPQLAGAPR
jgi:hypothetical protein